jgi:hypothetical protein
MMNDQDPSSEAPIDLTPLDPLVDVRRFDALASRIVRDGMHARRGTTIALRSPSVMADVARWSMPVLAAAALVVAAAIPTLAVFARRLSSADAPSGQIDRLGFPAPILALTRSGSDPTPAEVIAAFDSRWFGGPR